MPSTHTLSLLFSQIVDTHTATARRARLPLPKPPDHMRRVPAMPTIDTRHHLTPDSAPAHDTRGHRPHAPLAHRAVHSTPARDAQHLDCECVTWPAVIQ